VPTLRFLAISGSLRAASSNTALLEAARALAPAGLAVELFAGLGELPHFNPDLDREGVAPPPAVAALRAQIAAADAVLVSSPEYAHGVPGSLKNALDWLVGGAEIVGKPVALFHASPRATLALASLADTLATISARLVPEAAVMVNLLGRKIDAAGIAADPEIAAAVRQALAALARAAVGVGKETAGALPLYLPEDPR
jgi:chromate reductase